MSSSKEYLRNYMKDYWTRVPEAREKSKEYYRNNPEKWLLTRARSRAKTLGLEFNLEVSDIPIPKLCPILGIELLPVLSKGAKRASPSIDRVDPTKGYTKDNCRVISFRANSLKNNMTKDQIESLYKYVSSS